MNDQSKIKLFLRCKIFKISTDFQSICNIDDNVYRTLLSKKKYEIKSNISEEVLQSFINYWVNNEVPFFNAENINEYDQLSQEFDYMKNLVQIFKRKCPNLDTSLLLNEKEELKKQFKIKNDNLEAKTKKYHQTIHILFKDNEINTHERFLEVKKDLRNSCLSQDIKFIKLLTRKEAKFEGMSFILNEEEKTAFLLCNISAKGDILIPRTVNYKLKSFLVTKIIENAFKYSKDVKSIQFPLDSELECIERRSFFACSLESIIIPPKVTEIPESCFYLCKNLKKIEFSEDSKLTMIDKLAFYQCPIESLSIPATVTDLKKGWCNGTLDLTTIKIHPKNQNFIYFDGKFILGKTDEKSDIFDELVFARRNIEDALIPSSIEQIADFAFNNCKKLKKVEFENNSKLKIIGKSSFLFSSIEKVLIPSHVKQISESAFSFCNFLKKVEFAENSELQIIGENAFSQSQIKKILIPKFVTKILSYAFYYCKKLVKIEFANASELKLIDKYAFSMSNLHNFILPSNVIQISESAFSDCTQLNYFLIPFNSKLKIIDKKAFYNSNIKEIMIPSHVIKIEDSAFSDCRKLSKIIFQENSELRKIGQKAFSRCSLKSFAIPASVQAISENLFDNCWNLVLIEIDENMDLKCIHLKDFKLSDRIIILIQPKMIERIALASS